MVPDRADGRGTISVIRWNKIEVDAQRLFFRGLNRVGMRDNDHEGAGVALNDPGHTETTRVCISVKDSPPEFVRVALDDLQLGLADEVVKLLGPSALADVALGQFTIDAHRPSVPTAIGSAVSRARSSFKA